MALDRKFALKPVAAGILVALGIVALGLQYGCGKGGYSPTAPSAAPTATPGPAPVATPVVITAQPSGGSYAFSQSSVSVASGSSVTFNTPGHTVDIDDGLSDGLCGGHDFTTFPASFIFSGPSGALFHIHCDLHSSCGAGNCSGCTGMVMTVKIL